MTKLHDQPWQVPLEKITAPPASDAPVPEPVPTPNQDIVIGDIDISVDGPSALEPQDLTVEETPAVAQAKEEQVVAPAPVPEVDPVLAPDFSKGTGIPRFELFLTGELLAVSALPPRWACERY